MSRSLTNTYHEVWEVVVVARRLVVEIGKRSWKTDPLGVEVECQPPRFGLTELRMLQPARLGHVVHAMVHLQVFDVRWALPR